MRWGGCGWGEEGDGAARGVMGEGGGDLGVGE